MFHVSGLFRISISDLQLINCHACIFWYFRAYIDLMCICWFYPCLRVYNECVFLFVQTGPELLPRVSMLLLLTKVIGTSTIRLQVEPRIKRHTQYLRRVVLWQCVCVVGAGIRLSDGSVYQRWRAGGMCARRTAWDRRSAGGFTLLVLLCQRRCAEGQYLSDVILPLNMFVLTVLGLHN